MAGIELELKAGVSEEEMEAFAPLAKGLVLRVCRPGECPPLGGAEAVTQSNAILRTLAAARPDALLYGRDEFESAQVGHFSVCVREGREGGRARRRFTASLLPMEECVSVCASVYAFLLLRWGGEGKGYPRPF